MKKESENLTIQATKLNPVYLLKTHKAFAVYLATIVLMAVAHGIELTALFPLYLHDTMNEGADLIGITLSSYLVTDIFIRTPAGWLADRWARKPVLLIGIVLSALPLLAMPRVDSPELFLLLNAINGIGAGCVWPALYASVADRYGRARYGLLLGIINMALLGGIALGPIAGGLLLSRVSYVTAFYVCFALVAIALVLVIFFVRDHPKSDAPIETHGIGAWRGLARQMTPTLTRLLVIGTLLTLGIGMMLPLVSLFGRDVLRVTPDVFAFMLIPPGLITAALIIPAGHWADKHGRHLPLIVGLILIAIPFAGAPLSTNLFIVSAGATVAGIGYALMVPAWNALVMEWVPATSRGLFLGAVATAQGFGLAIGPTIGGELWERVGVYAPFGAAAFFLALAAVLSVVEARRHPN